MTFLTNEMSKQMHNGEAKGLTESGTVGKSPAKTYDGPLFPFRFRDEAGIMQLRFASSTMPFETWFLMSQKNGWINIDGLHDYGILDRLKTIFSASDDKWVMRMVDFTGDGKLLFWIDDISKLSTGEPKNCLSVEIGDAKGLAIQLCQSRSRDQKPYCKNLIKITGSEANGREWLFNRWQFGCEHEVYRIYPDCTPLRQTVEYYPPDVSLIIENL